MSNEDEPMREYTHPLILRSRRAGFPPKYYFGGVPLSNHGQAGLPPAILKHAGGMFHLSILEGRTAYSHTVFHPRGASGSTCFTASISAQGSAFCPAISPGTVAIV